MSSDLVSVLRLRVVADADPVALVRVLERFQNLNLLPRRVLAEFGIGDTVHVEVDITGIAEDMLTLIASKLRATPCIRNAYWHRA
jgi:hypothetical protein